MAKEFKTIDELIEIMESRGIIADERTKQAIMRETTRQEKANRRIRDKGRAEVWRPHRLPRDPVRLEFLIPSQMKATGVENR